MGFFVNRLGVTWLYSDDIQSCLIWHSIVRGVALSNPSLHISRECIQCRMALDPIRAFV
jgi:hypothetical protein